MCGGWIHQIYRASFAHAQLLVFKGFKAVVDTSGAAVYDQHQFLDGRDRSLERVLDEATSRALDLLLSLLGLHWVQKDMGDFVEDGALGDPLPPKQSTI